ncbi:MAG: hypothetical protein FWE67_03055 [Planctomycetaceae bacterium]|nr:hypothetical protein [Planctomycetaceae bacterium]
MTNENCSNLEKNTVKHLPGVCLSWDEVKERYGEIQGDEEQIKRIWTENDAEVYDYYWQCLLSF